MAEQDTHNAPDLNGQDNAPDNPDLDGQNNQPVQEKPVSKEEIMQEFRSWQGRRDKEFRDQLISEVSELMKPFMRQDTPSRTDNDPADFTTKFLENPEGTLETILQRHEEKKGETQRQYAQEVAKLLSADPYLNQDENREVGLEVIEELKRIPLTPGLNPAIQARMAVSDATSRVYSRRIAGTKKTALDNNRPTNTPKGGIQANPEANKAKADTSKVTDEIRAWGKKMGYESDEDIAAAIGDSE